MVFTLTVRHVAALFAMFCIQNKLMYIMHTESIVIVFVIFRTMLKQNNANTLSYFVLIHYNYYNLIFFCK